MTSEVLNADAGAEREKNYAAQLRALRDEREAILDLTHPDLQPELANLRRIRAHKQQVEADKATYKRADSRARAASERLSADSEFEAAKADLRVAMLASNGAVRRRVDALRAPRSSVKRRRPSSSATSPRRVVRRTETPAFVASLERQGVVRLGLSPDEVNADLAAAMRSVDVARTRALPPGATAGSSEGAFAPAGERVHTSRGTLHFHDDVFEKGDTVAIYANKPSSLPKYHGVIQVINRREVNVMSGEAGGHKVMVSHLKSGRFIMKRDPTGTALRNARLPK